MFISQAWAQAAAPVSAGASVGGTVFELIAIFLIFYLLLIRPQQKKMKQHETELKAIKVGDEVLTGGGLYAKVTAIKDDDIMAEIAHGVTVKMYRYTIREVLSEKTLQNVKQKRADNAESKHKPNKKNKAK